MGGGVDVGGGDGGGEDGGGGGDQITTCSHCYIYSRENVKTNNPTKSATSS